MRTSNLLGLLLLFSQSVGAFHSRVEGQQSLANSNGKITFKSDQSTPLSAVLEIAMAKDIPLGIIFGEKPLLCGKPRPLDIKDLSFQDAFAAAVEGTGYVVALEGGVYVLKAPDTTEHENSILSHRFDRFSAPKTTMSGIGGQLAGYIETVVDGAKGFALNILSNPDEKLLDIGVIKDATTEEIANRIVMLGNNGAWIFRPTPVPKQPSEAENPIQIFAYERDEIQLRKVSCQR